MILQFFRHLREEKEINGSLHSQGARRVLSAGQELLNNLNRSLVDFRMSVVKFETLVALLAQ